MMKHTILALAMLCMLPLHAHRQDYTVRTDQAGQLYRTDTGAPVRYYGTNYTAPFAHAFRALGAKGADRKEAIRGDVYHMARLGLNAFRLHLWEAELTDSLGNLLEGEHLDLLDFLLSELQGRGIDIVLTAQTSFGNGYPDKDTDTGAFTYDYAKCDIHRLPQAQACQENYLSQLMAHRNPYTGRTYAGDKAIIAVEINNEPCHAGATESEVTAYIDRMSNALRRAGYDRMILYNVTHNPQVRDAYGRASDVQGFTYQWYPTGLVHGSERRGNLLPLVQDYPHPYARAGKAKFVYEFDPADVLQTYLYPAVARTFLAEGFQWMTQFAYDPTLIAAWNTEYPTHWLNLAYTPGKAIGMLIAARMVQTQAEAQGHSRNTAPLVETDPKRDLAYLLTGDEFYYTNDCPVTIADPSGIAHVAGVGSSQLVQTRGRGAYFLDRLDDSVWRLELMPTPYIVANPFDAHPSLNHRVADVEDPSVPVPMAFSLPGLPADFTLTRVDGTAAETLHGQGGTASPTPGVWLLAPRGTDLSAFTPSTPVGRNGNISLAEYYAPPSGHTPKTGLPAPTLELEAKVSPWTEGAWFRPVTNPDGTPSWLLDFTPLPEHGDHIEVFATLPSQADMTQGGTLYIRFHTLPEGADRFTLALTADDYRTYKADLTAADILPSPEGGWVLQCPVDSLVYTPLTNRPVTPYPDLIPPVISTAALPRGKAHPMAGIINLTLWTTPCRPLKIDISEAGIKHTRD